jgi:peptidoglycan/xylan/chitin deacetylase (PgdA/CDA1 family)
MNDYTVLLFHSVDDRDLLSLKGLGNISPGLFERLLLLLKKNFVIVSLDEMVKCISGETEIEGRLLALTFDDGPKSYADKALPLMESLGIPSICFLITDCVGDNEIYWRYLFNYCINSGHYEGLAELIQKEYGISVFNKDILSFTRSNFSREKTRRIVSGIFTDLVSEQRYRDEEKGLFLSHQDVEHLRNNPLVDFGIHTRTHPVMSQLSKEEIYEEISGSIRYYRTRIKDETPMFSVPFGRLFIDYDENTVFAAKDLGVKVMLSAYGGGNIKGQPLYNIRRISVNEGMLTDGMEIFMEMLNNSRPLPEYAEHEKKLGYYVSGRV